MGKEIMKYEDAMAYVRKKLGASAIMQLAACKDKHVTIRTISAIMYEDSIVFKTDKNFDKTKDLLESDCNVALCKYNINVEGKAVNKGLVVDEPDQKFIKLYDKHLNGSYNAYSHIEDEILIEVVPDNIRIWDTRDEDNHAFKIHIDCIKKEAIKEWYDEQ